MRFAVQGGNKITVHPVLQISDLYPSQKFLGHPVENRQIKSEGVLNGISGL